jgi:hypothetical protein
MANQKGCGRKQFVLYQHLRRGTEQNREKISHDSWSTNLDIIRFHFGLETTKHETGLTTTWPQIISKARAVYTHLCILLTIPDVRCLTSKRLSLLKILMNFSKSYRFLSNSQLATLLYKGESIITRNVCFIFIKTRVEILQLHNFST